MVFNLQAKHARCPVASRAMIVLWRMALISICALFAFAVPSVSASAPQVSFAPLTTSVPVGTPFWVDVTVSAISDLYSVDMQLAFDPAILQVVDCTSGLPSTQIRPGDIFPADSPPANQVDNVTGHINYSITGYNSGAFSGSGVIARICFRAIAIGSSPLSFPNPATNPILSDTAFNPLARGADTGSYTVTVAQTATPTPTSTSTSVPSPTPTATATATPQPTNTSTPSVTPTQTVGPSPTTTATATQTSAPSATPSATSSATPSPTASMTSTPGPTNTATNTPINTPTATSTLTASPTSTTQPSPTATNTPIPTPTATATRALRRAFLPLVIKGMVITTPTPTPSPTPTGACGELVVNGNCEANTAWTFIATEYTAGYSTTRAHGGTRSLRTGIETGAPEYSYSSVKQSVYVPLDARHMNLSFWYYPVATGSANDDDKHYVLIIDQYGFYHFLTYLTYPQTNQRTWVQAQFNEATLAQFRGQRIFLHFETYNNSWGGIAAMYVDDVSFVVCP